VFKKPILIGETGWPSQGRQRFWSKPSAINQARYMREFLQAAQVNHWQYNVIEAVDQPWKRELEGTVGGYWGVLDTDLQLKFNLQGPVAERQDGVKPYLVALVLAVVALGWGKYKRAPVNQMLLLALTGAVLGLHAYLQVNYVHLAARNTGEVAMLGGLVVLGWALLLLQLRQWLGLGAKLCLEQSLLRLLALAFLITSAGLAINGRYLDFPLILVCLPLVGISISLITPAVREESAVINQTGVWLTAVMVLMAANMAVAVAMMEPGNVIAWWWCGACGLALFVLPARSLQLSGK